MPITLFMVRLSLDIFALVSLMSAIAVTCLIIGA